MGLSRSGAHQASPGWQSNPTEGSWSSETTPLASSASHFMEDSIRRSRAMESSVELRSPPRRWPSNPTAGSSSVEEGRRAAASPSRRRDFCLAESEIRRSGPMGRSHSPPLSKKSIGVQSIDILENGDIQLSGGRETNAENRAL